MLDVSNVSKSFCEGEKRVQAAEGVSFSIPDGRILALVGESGCGKSTLARMISGLLMPDGGTITLDGLEITPRARRKNPRLASAVQLVMQNSAAALDPLFTVMDTIAEPLHCLKSMSKKDITAAALRMMDELELPRSLAGRRSGDLSGGQQKRICLARALITRPRLLILDEAVTGLDMLLRKQVLDLILRLHGELNFSCLSITHDMAQAAYMADLIAVMKDGRLEECRPWRGAQEDFSSPYARQLFSHL